MKAIEVEWSKRQDGSFVLRTKVGEETRTVVEVWFSKLTNDRWVNDFCIAWNPYRVERGFQTAQEAMGDAERRLGVTEVLRLGESTDFNRRAIEALAVECARRDAERAADAASANGLAWLPERH